MLENLEALVRGSRMFNLAQPLANGMPMFPAHVSYCFSMNMRHSDMVFEDGSSGANDVIITSGHSGTHIDAIGHFSRNGRLYGGVDALANQSGQTGLAAFGIETTAPILRRAVLLDVAAFRGTEVLDAGYAVTADDLRRTADMEGVRLRPGDVALVRTGWARHWGNPVKFVGWETGAPGPGLEGARWLAESGVSLAGSDTTAFEVWPGGGVHSLLLVDNGIQILENLNLEELARERIYAFMLFVAPLKIVGGTASPVTPVAICPGG